MLPPKFDYLFVADFKDGSRYFQTQADASVVHPLTKSAFWDVLQRIEEVKKFTLIDRHNQHEHTVFLDDGHFKTDGKILVCPRNGLTNFRLIYFRRAQQSHEQEIRSFHPKPYYVGYFIGWQANLFSDMQLPENKRTNYKMILEIPPLGSLEKVKVI